jgi:hypothetical protein
MRVGNERGRWMMKEKPKILAKHDIEVEDEAAREIRETVRSSSITSRRSTTEKELIHLSGLEGPERSIGVRSWER